ncbi:luciferase-like monooxygenase family protein [Mycobacterium ulcerans str. Harvey]|uniref:Luciferase-like monooxygenase family protein n=1 Tax=Mycobacterium ulcerans str. Harvey TaxID=1299332 RepID=A0ABN0QLQ5_MYCUL|nr:luciferase-like monooxygenase family protein [Mycobacterium ulcerans str. Harvey]
MRIGLAINYAGGFKEVAAEVADLERAGLDIVFVPEAYSFDAVSALGYLAACTDRVQARLGHPAAVHADAHLDGDDRGRAGLCIRR